MAKPAPQIGSWTLPPLLPWARGLMIALVAIFLVQVLVRTLLGFDSGRYAAVIEGPLALSGAGVFVRGFAWQPLSYFWLSSLQGVFPIVITALSVYFFGSALEQRMGGPRMLVAFVSAGVAGGLLSLLVLLLLPQEGFYDVRLMGAQACTSGLIATLCWLWKDRRMHLLIIDPTGTQLLLGYIALTVIQGLLSHPFYIVPDLGGIAMGVLIGAGKGPYVLVQRVRLWRLRRKIRSIRGGKDDRDWMN